MTFLRPRRPRLAVAGAVLLAAIVALVWSGAVSSIDRLAVAHLMPWLEPHGRSAVTFASLALPRAHGPVGVVLLGLWAYPAAFVPSLLIVLLCARRLEPGRGVTLIALWLAGNLAELVGKLTITRPALYKEHVHVAAFDSSLPSGHTIRSLVVAGAVTLAAPRIGRAAFVWACGVLVALVVGGAHTPTDVVAGVLAGVVLAGWAPVGLDSLKWGRTRMGGERGRTGRGP